MNYTFTPSLEHRALVKMTAALWNRRDIRDLVARCSTLNNLTVKEEEWQVIEDKVIGSVPKLPLPESQKEEAMDLARRMGLEVKKWKEHHLFQSGHHLGADVPAELCWTPQGTVDQKKTAEALVEDESVDINTRYKLACFCCLEDDINKLWNLMPERNKEDIYNGLGQGMSFTKDRMLLQFWTYVMRGESSKYYNSIKIMMFVQEVSSPDQLLFEYSVSHRNKVASEYFLQKLTPSQRDEILVRSAADLAKNYSDSIDSNDIEPGDNLRLNYNAEIMCFLLSQMNSEQQEEVIKSHPAGVLLCLLDWPWESFFMETANRVWDVLSEEHYERLFKVMVNRVKHGFKNCSYQELFVEFWQQSPDTYKKYVCGRLTVGSSLSDLLLTGDKENIRLFFKSVTVKNEENFDFFPGCANSAWRLFKKF